MPVVALLLALLASDELLYPTPKLALASRELQIVSLSAKRFTEPGTDPVPWARPWVTFWKFSLTSPSEEDIRVTPGCVLAPPPEMAKWPSAWTDCPFAALRGAESPVFGTMIRSIDEARGLPCSIGFSGPDPLRERPALPFAKAVATCPGITWAIWPDLKSAT